MKKSIYFLSGCIMICGLCNLAISCRAISYYRDLQWFKRQNSELNRLLVVAKGPFPYTNTIYVTNETVYFKPESDSPEWTGFILTTSSNQVDGYLEVNWQVRMKQLK